MPYHTPILGEASAGNNTGSYRGYDVRVKGDGRVELTQDDDTWLYHDYIDAIHWIDVVEGPVVAPTLTSLEPAEAAIGGADVTLRVLGSDFAPYSVIVFNGGDERTTYVSESEVTTIVKPSLAGQPIDVPVAVRTVNETSNSLQFSFTAEAKR